MIRERERAGTFLSTFVFLFERKGMSQSKFVDNINGQSLPVNEHPPYRHIPPLNQSSLSRILAGTFIPDAETLYRIARFGFGLSIEACCKLEDIRWEAYLLAQEERRTTQQMVAVQKEPEVKKAVVEEKGDKLPAWIFS